MKINLRQNKAITLIALVITIIVLLILAGVTIASLTGENGLLSRATGTKDATSISKLEEELSLAYNDTVIEKMTSGKDANVSITDWMFKMIDDGKTIIIEKTDNENEYFVTIDEEDDLYMFSTSTKKISKYDKKFSTEWYKEYTYETDDSNNTIILTKYNGTDKVAYVGKSAKIGTKEYTTIIQGKKDDSGNIIDTIFGETAANKVKIQSGITEIGDGAFYNNSNLKSIIIPNGVNNIGNNSFSGSLENLEMVYIPSGVIKTPNSSFNNCNKLTTAIIGAKEITNGTFYNCKNLANIKFLQGVEIITNSSFAFSQSEPNNSLKELIFPDGIKTINNGTFTNCSALENVIIPSGTELVGSGAFANSTILRNVSIGAKEVDLYSAKCENIENINFLLGAETIKRENFKNLNRVKNIQFPNTIKNIEEGCFQNCNSLQKVIIPDGVECIDDGCFANCYFLEEVIIGAERIRQAFSGCQSLKTIKISNSVQSIDTGAFNNNSLDSQIKTTVYTSNQVAKEYNWSWMKREVIFIENEE